MNSLIHVPATVGFSQGVNEPHLTFLIFFILIPTNVTRVPRHNIRVTGFLAPPRLGRFSKIIPVNQPSPPLLICLKFSAYELGTRKRRSIIRTRVGSVGDVLRYISVTQTSILDHDPGSLEHVCQV